MGRHFDRWVGMLSLTAELNPELRAQRRLRHACTDKHERGHGAVRLRRGLNGAKRPLALLGKLDEQGYYGL